jgi:hypothetical protein
MNVKQNWPNLQMTQSKLNNCKKRTFLFLATKLPTATFENFALKQRDLNVSHKLFKIVTKKTEKFGQTIRNL